MLDPRTELGQNGIGHIGGQLGAEEHAHTLGADEFHRLLDLLQEGLGGVLEQQVGLVEEEHQLGLVDVADFGEFVEQFGQHPHQERGEHRRTGGLIAHLEQGDDAASLVVDAQQIGGLQFRFPEEGVPAVGLEVDQCPQDHPGGLRGHRAEGLQLGLALVSGGQEGDHRTKVFQIEQG